MGLSQGSCCKSGLRKKAFKGRQLKTAFKGFLEEGGCQERRIFVV